MDTYITYRNVTCSECRRFTGGDCGRHKDFTDTDTPVTSAVARNPKSQRFHDILRELGTLHDMKQRDYGKPDDPFANVRASEEWGLAPWVGAMVRLTDKVRRLQALARTGALVNEAAEDSFRDIAVYAVIALVLYEESRGA